MRFLAIYRSRETGLPPSSENMAAMGKLIEEMAKAGVLLATEGCLPSSQGARIRLSGGKFTVTDGPFTETKQVIGGFAKCARGTNRSADRILLRLQSCVGSMKREATPTSSGRCWRRTSGGKSSRAFRTAVSMSDSPTCSATSSVAFSRTSRASSPWAKSSSSPQIASSPWGTTAAGRRLPGKSSAPSSLTFRPRKAARSFACSRYRSSCSCVGWVVQRRRQSHSPQKAQT
jgi:hypothetical protein